MPYETLARVETDPHGNTSLTRLIDVLTTLRAAWGNIPVAMDNEGMEVGIVCDPPIMAVRVERPVTEDDRNVTAIIEWSL